RLMRICRAVVASTSSQSPFDRDGFLRGVVGDGKNFLHANELSRVGLVDIGSTRLVQGGVQPFFRVLQTWAQRRIVCGHFCNSRGFDASSASSLRACRRRGDDESVVPGQELEPGLRANLGAERPSPTRAYGIHLTRVPPDELSRKNSCNYLNTH